MDFVSDSWSQASFNIGAHGNNTSLIIYTQTFSFTCNLIEHFYHCFVSNTQFTVHVLNILNLFLLSVNCCTQLWLVCFCN